MKSALCQTLNSTDILLRAVCTTPLKKDVYIMPTFCFKKTQYVEIAKSLAANKDRLRGFRATLRDEFLQSPLGDGPRYQRNVEAMYQVCERVCTSVRVRGVFVPWRDIPVIQHSCCTFFISKLLQPPKIS